MGIQEKMPYVFKHVSLDFCNVAPDSSFDTCHLAIREIREIREILREILFEHVLHAIH